MTKNGRFQIIIDLGRGERGAEYRQALAVEAKRHGLKLSSWARRTLLAAVHLDDTCLPSQAALDALEARVTALEEKLARVLHEAQR